MKVRDLLRRLTQDGWREVRTRGSHRILKHPIKTGIVVIAGQPNKDIAIGTLKSIAKQAELEDLK
jgi:predicted RNA binding protein YcfA (HicA-like mRNA interferase family)